MRRFTLVTGMGEAELQADPEGAWVPVKDLQILVDRLENAANSWKYDDEVSRHVSTYLLNLVEAARR